MKDVVPRIQLSVLGGRLFLLPPSGAISVFIEFPRLPPYASPCPSSSSKIVRDNARRIISYGAHGTNKQCNNITAALRMLLLFLHAVKKIIIESPLSRAVSRPCSSDEDENGE